MKTDRIRQLAVGFLLLEALSASLWWLMLWLFPSTRSWFVPPRVPEIVLLAFFLPDAVFFIGAALVAALGLSQKRAWAWPVLCAHCGAVGYATLFTFALCVWGSGGFLGAALMTPCATVLMFLTWQLRPGRN